MVHMFKAKNSLMTLEYDKIGNTCIHWNVRLFGEQYVNVYSNKPDTDWINLCSHLNRDHSIIPREQEANFW